MRIRNCLLTAALTVPALANANDLLRVYDLAIENDATIEAALYERNAAVEARPQARAALLPQVSASYDYRYIDSEQTVKSATPGFGGTTRTSGTNKNLSVSLNQSLFDIASWRRLQQASEQVALAEATYRNAGQNLMLRVSTAYFNVLSAQDALRSAKAEQAALEQQLEQARKRFDVGLSAITDVQEAQARYDLTVALVLQSEQALAAANEALTEITGGPIQRINGLVEDIPLPGPDPDKPADWVATARETNLDLLSAKLAAEAASRGVQVARAGHLPTIGLFAGYNDNAAETGAFPTDSTSTAAGAQVTLPILAGGLVHSQVNQAIATREQRKAQVEAARRLVERTTRDAFQGVVTGVAQVKAYKQAVVSSTTALEASQTGLEVGTRTAVDVLNAQQQLYAAQRNYYKSRYDYLISVLRLKAAAGTLSAKDLGQVDSLLVQPVGTAPAAEPVAESERPS